MRLPSYQDLSKEQDDINNLPIEGKYLVTGPPGTGKTIMALYRAQMLSISDLPVDMIMYSRPLSWYTGSTVEELKINGTVRTYHKWIHHFWHDRYRHSPPMSARWRHDWHAAVRQVASDPPEQGSVPQLIVDEAQDLPKDFFFLARYLAANLMVFADENQRITDDNSTIAEIATNLGKVTSRHELRTNYRNTREIAELARHYCVSDAANLPDLPTRRGELPVVRRFFSTPDFVDFLARYERNNADLEIGVLCATTALQNEIERALLRRRCANPVQNYVSGYSDAPLKFDTPGITIINHKSMKGLEFDTVFLPELQRIQNDPGSVGFKMTMYVAVTRARSELYLLWSGPIADPPVIADVPEALVETQ